MATNLHLGSPTSVSDLSQMNTNLLEKAALTADIDRNDSRHNQDISLTFTSPSVADNVPCIDTSIFTTLPSASFDALLQQYEDPVSEVSNTLHLSPQKENLTILPLEGVEENAVSQNSGSLLPDWPLCSCSVEVRGEEVPVEQVFIRGGQMYRLPEACLIYVGNTELYGFYKGGQWYVSLVMLYHLIGIDAQTLYEKAILSATNLDIMTMGDNELELLTQKCGFDTEIASRDLISVACLQALSRYISETNELPALRNIAQSDVYKKILGNIVRCSNCGLTIKKESVDERYELIWKQTHVKDIGAESKVTVTAGFVSASNAKFCGFQLNDSIYLNLAEMIRFKLFTWSALQKKLSSLDIFPIAAPPDVTAHFEIESAVLIEGMWLDLVTLRCVCCMGNGKCNVKGHSEDAWHALKLGKCSYDPAVSFLVEDTTKIKTNINLPSIDSEMKKLFSKATVGKPVRLDTKNIHAVNKKLRSNGSDDRVSSTTDFLPVIPKSQTLPQVTHASVAENKMADIQERHAYITEIDEMVNNVSEPGVFEFKVAEPSGEVVEVKIAEDVDKDGVKSSNVLEEDSAKNLQYTPQYCDNRYKIVDRADLESCIEVTVQETDQVQDIAEANEKENYIVERPEELKQNYFMARPRGRPTKSHETYVVRSSVEKSTKRGRRFMSPGDYIVPDVAELNKLIQCKLVILCEKSVSGEIVNGSRVARSNHDIQSISTKDSEFMTDTPFEKINSAGKNEKNLQSSVIKYQKKIHKRVGDTNNVNIPITDASDKRGKITQQDGDLVKLDANSSAQVEVLGHHTEPSKKVIKEYLICNMGEEKEKLTSNKKDVEMTEALEKSESNANGSFKKTESILPKIVESEKKEVSSETENMQDNTMVFNNSAKEKEHSFDISECCTSTTYSQTKSLVKTPPSKRVERLCTKLSSSENLNRPDISLLTLATLASENVSDSDMETDQVEVTNTIAEEGSAKAQTGKSLCGSTFKFEDLSAEEIEILKTENQNKLEIMLSKIKELIVFGFDRECGLLKVKLFDKQARTAFPALFLPDSRRLRTEFAVTVSKYIAKNFMQFASKNEKFKVSEKVGCRKATRSGPSLSEKDQPVDKQSKSSNVSGSKMGSGNEGAKISNSSTDVTQERSFSGTPVSRPLEVPCEEISDAEIAQDHGNKDHAEKSNDAAKLPVLLDYCTNTNTKAVNAVQNSQQATFTESLNAGTMSSNVSRMDKMYESHMQKNKRLIQKSKRYLDKNTSPRKCTKQSASSEKSEIAATSILTYDNIVLPDNSGKVQRSKQSTIADNQKLDLVSNSQCNSNQSEMCQPDVQKEKTQSVKCKKSVDRTPSPGKKRKFSICSEKLGSSIVSVASNKSTEMSTFQNNKQTTGREIQNTETVSDTDKEKLHQPGSDKKERQSIKLKKSYDKTVSPKKLIQFSVNNEIENKDGVLADNSTKIAAGQKGKGSICRDNQTSDLSESLSVGEYDSNKLHQHYSDENKYTAKSNRLSDEKIALQKQCKKLREIGKGKKKLKEKELQPNFVISIIKSGNQNTQVDKQEKRHLVENNAPEIQESHKNTKGSKLPLDYTQSRENSFNNDKSHSPKKQAKSKRKSWETETSTKLVEETIDVSTETGNKQQEENVKKKSRTGSEVLSTAQENTQQTTDVIDSQSILESRRNCQTVIIEKLYGNPVVCLTKLKISGKDRIFLSDKSQYGVNTKTDKQKAKEKNWPMPETMTMQKHDTFDFYTNRQVVEKTSRHIQANSEDEIRISEKVMSDKTATKSPSQKANSGIRTSELISAKLAAKSPSRRNKDMNSETGDTSSSESFKVLNNLQSEKGEMESNEKDGVVNGKKRKFDEMGYTNEIAEDNKKRRTELTDK